MVQIILGSIAGAIALVRLGFKIFVVRNMSPDDYAFILLTLIIAPSITLTHFGTILNGLGRDIWTLTPQTITNFLFWYYVQIIFYFINVTLIKLCLVLFYLRIFPSQTVRQLLLGTLVFIVLYGIIFFFISIFQCSPISLFWNQWEGGHEGKCLTLNAIGWANAIIGVILDFWMLAIPMAELRKLRLSWKRKIGVAMMFCLGTLYVVPWSLPFQWLLTFLQASRLCPSSASRRSSRLAPLKTSPGTTTPPCCGPGSRSTAASFASACPRCAWYWSASSPPRTTAIKLLGTRTSGPESPAAGTSRRVWPKGNSTRRGRLRTQIAHWGSGTPSPAPALFRQWGRPRSSRMALFASRCTRCNTTTKSIWCRCTLWMVQDEAWEA